jgi:hypothetical protein
MRVERAEDHFLDGDARRNECSVVLCVICSFGCHVRAGCVSKRCDTKIVCVVCLSYTTCLYPAGWTAFSQSCLCLTKEISKCRSEIVAARAIERESYPS